MTPLEKIKIISNYTDDDRINVLIDMTKDELVHICELSNYLDEFDNILVDMVIFKLNRLGKEGLTNITLRNIGENYLNDYPKHITDRLDMYNKRVRFR